MSKSAPIPVDPKDLMKLNQMFRINPLYEADGYKPGHYRMLAENTVREYWHWVPRSLKYLHSSISMIMSGGNQLTMRYIHSNFQECFFNVDKEVAMQFGKDMAAYLGSSFNDKHFGDLYDLGYLPLKIQALEEGTFTKANIPHMAGISTGTQWAWLGLFLETLFSKLSWQLPIAATIGNKFKTNAHEWAMKTNSAGIGFVDFACHDFHSRGGNPFTSIAIGLGHAFSNRGSDTLNVIPASRYYYDEGKEDVCINSVNAGEHSVTCTRIFFFKELLETGKLDHEIKLYYSFDLPCEGSVEGPDLLAIAEFLTLRSLLLEFPDGVLSYVADTFDLWKLITFILPRLKKEILARNGTLVIRPDSGDPVDIICGRKNARYHEGGETPLHGYQPKGWYQTEVSGHSWDEGASFIDWSQPISDAEQKGVTQLLWDLFGGTESKEGYKVLDSHIGAIYGDSITLERQVDIYSRLEENNFASTNVVLGVGSFTYVMLTRDSAGYAAKGAWFEVEDNEVKKTFDIYKDPITDDGTKKSLKGFQYVYRDKDGEIQVESGVSEEKAFSEDNLLQVIYEDGKFYNQTTLTEIRKRLEVK